MHEPATSAPIACTLSPAAQRRRRSELRHQLFAQVTEVDERPDGYVFTFRPQPDLTARLEEFIAVERQCCGFLQGQVDPQPGEHPPRLILTGPVGTKDFLRRNLPAELLARGSTAGPARLDRWLVGVGLTGLSTAALTLLCCVTPLLAGFATTLGVGVGVAALVGYIDPVALPLLGASFALIAVPLWRRRRMGGRRQAVDLKRIAEKRGTT